MTDAESITVRNWLRDNCIRCPRCGGAAQGYSTWEVDDEHQQVVCDNCFFPLPEESNFQPIAYRQGAF